MISGIVVFPSSNLIIEGWENPLMGWTSTGDPHANVGEAGPYFDTEAAARAFSQNDGWEYTEKKRHSPLLKLKSCEYNFKWKGPPKSEDDY